jgi:enoyl-CoA hydratase/carnithine racemase
MDLKKNIRLQIFDDVSVIVLDNPPDNRMNLEFFNQLEEAVKRLEYRSNMKGLIIKTGGRHFSSGADVDELTERILKAYLEGIPREEVIKKILKRNSDVFKMIENLECPVITAVSGFCVGSGLELALACNIRICSDNAMFGLPEITWRLITGCGGSSRLERLVGKSKAKEMILTGDMVNAKEAYKIGLVNRIAEGGKLIKDAFQMIRGQSDNSKTIKKCLYTEL